MSAVKLSSQESPRLYGYWRSSASWRVRWGFELKKMPYEYIPVNILKGEHREAAHLKRNPFGLLPVLEIGGQYVAESIAILDWMDRETPGLFPQDPLLRAKVLELCEFINSETAPLQTPLVQKQHSNDPAEQKAWAQHFTQRGLDGFAAARPDKKATFSVGNELTAADLFLIPQLYNALRYELPVKERWPELWAIYDRCLKMESCQKASPERQVDAVK